MATLGNDPILVSGGFSKHRFVSISNLLRPSCLLDLRDGSAITGDVCARRPGGSWRNYVGARVADLSDRSRRDHRQGAELTPSCGASFKPSDCTAHIEPIGQIGAFAI